MKSRKEGERHILVLARGEELIDTLTNYCEQQEIKNAIFQGIGAVENVEIGYYSLAKREYYFRKDDSVFEVASMQGNVALVEGKPFIHAHAVLSRCDESLECIGAHIKRAYVAVTLEVLMTVLEKPVERMFNDEIGLRLITV